MSNQIDSENQNAGAGPAPSAWQSLLHRQTSLHNVNEEHAQSLSAVERLALWITAHVGTMGFFLTILAWTIIWLSWNFLAPKQLQFDPPTAFVLWLFISNMIQILLMPLIMVGQNLQGRHAEMRAQNDYEVNMHSEAKIELLLTMMERHQAILDSILEHIRIDVPTAIDAITRASTADAPQTGDVVDAND